MFEFGRLKILGLLRIHVCNHVMAHLKTKIGENISYYAINWVVVEMYWNYSGVVLEFSGYQQISTLCKLFENSKLQSIQILIAGLKINERTVAWGNLNSSRAS